MDDHLLDEAVKDFADLLGSAAVEPEGALVKVGLEVLLVDAALVRGAQPSLQQRGNQVNVGEELQGTFRIAANRRDPVSISGRPHPVLAIPVVGVHLGAFLHAVDDEPNETVARSVGHTPRANTAHLQIPLKRLGADAGLLRAQQPSRQEPFADPRARVVQNRPCSRRRLPIAPTTVQRAPRARPTIAPPAPRTHKAFWPPNRAQVLQARLLRRESVQELDQVPGKPLAIASPTRILTTTHAGRVV